MEHQHKHQHHHGDSAGSGGHAHEHVDGAAATGDSGVSSAHAGLIMQAMSITSRPLMTARRLDMRVWPPWRHDNPGQIVAE